MGHVTPFDNPPLPPPPPSPSLPPLPIPSHPLPGHAWNQSASFRLTQWLKIITIAAA